MRSSDARTASSSAEFHCALPKDVINALSKPNREVVLSLARKLAVERSSLMGVHHEINAYTMKQDRVVIYALRSSGCYVLRTYETRIS